METVGSRSEAERLLSGGRVLVDGRPRPKSHRLAGGEVLSLTVPERRPSKLEPEELDVSILYEDDNLLVVDKPAGIVVHPSAGHARGTLVHGLLARGIAGGGEPARPGIVHRLDRGTSGPIVVAKHDAAHRRLAEQFRKREVEKRYLALVYGRPPRSFAVDQAIGRDRRHRTKISSRTQRPRQAKSEFTRLECLPWSALLEVKIRTGRTHQIRVHSSEASYPVVGDRSYGAPGPRTPLPRREAAAFRLLRDFGRPALHASGIELRHPVSGERLRFSAPLPQDMAELLTELRRLSH